MRTFFALLIACTLSCATTRSTEASTAPMQDIVDRIASRHPEVARLSIHASPSPGDAMEIVASTVAGRVGERSDPEDLEALSTGSAVEMMEAHNLDYTIPVHDDAGKVLAVVGVTISGAAGGSEADLRERARAIAEEAAAAIRDGA